MIKHFLSDLYRWRYYQQQLDSTLIQRFEQGNCCGQQSSANSPIFSVKPEVGPMPYGWYMLEIRARLCVGRSFCKLYVDYGSGYNESDCSEIPITSGKTSKQVIYFPAVPKSLQLVTRDDAIEFTIEHLRICKLSAKRATQLMLKKLEAGSYRLEAGLNRLQALSFKLQAAYNAFFEDMSFSPDYQQWIERVEQPLFGNIDKLRTSVVLFPHQPLISIVMPTFNTAERFLREAIDSVLNQVYPNWELCIADDCSTEPYIRPLLADYASRDERIKVVFRDKNGHISEASNSAMALVSGDYIALLDHDDTLAPHALYCVVERLNERPGTRLIYSDEDKIDERGDRQTPHFKPDWNRDLFYSHNYITHLTVAESALVREIGGFRVGVEGSQDYDFLLRIIAKIDDNDIVHIPHVLYHWRAIIGSTALQGSEKSYAEKAGQRALENYFAMIGEPASVEKGLVPNSYRVRWPLPSIIPLVSLIIPTRDGVDVLKQCVESILKKTTYQNYEIVILDNQSTCRKTLAYLNKLKSLSRVRVIPYNFPFNYSAINNFGVECANGSIIGLVNNDIEVITPEWLTEMVSHAVRKDIGCVGAKLFYPDMHIQHAGVVLGIGGVAGHSHKHFSFQHAGYFSRLKLIQNYSAVTAAVLLVKKSVYLQVGGLNEEHLTVAFNDVDFCLKVKECGYRNLWTPYAELFHHESVSRGKDTSPDKVCRFRNEVDYMISTWDSLLQADPAYNPNLTNRYDDFSFQSE